ncbi:MAG: putative Ig domain-containing protein, partial [Bacteroidota bacterium]
MKQLLISILTLLLFSLGLYAQSPPYFTSTPVTLATEDSPYTYTATALDDEADPMTFTAEQLPSWLDFDEGTQELFGTPTNDNVGNHDVTLRVTAGGDFEDQIFTIVVSNTNDPPVFTSTPVTTATEDSPYTYTATVNDPDPGEVLTWSTSTLPSWLTFSGSQVLSGTPANADVGSHSITITVDDGDVAVDQDFTIVVSNTNDPPVFTSTPVTTATEDSPYTYTAT